MAKKFKNFSEFYYFYLSQHQNSTCRLLHYSGTTIALIVMFYAFGSGSYYLLWLCLPLGYTFAWIGHLFFEKNRPATFKYPIYSFLGDWKMFGHKIISIIRERSIRSCL